MSISSVGGSGTTIPLFDATQLILAQTTIQGNDAMAAQLAAISEDLNSTVSVLA
jgi:hypothetical protein